MTKNRTDSEKSTMLLSWSSFCSRIDDVASAHLNQSYDHIFYIVRGGMTVAHRLAHILGCKSGGFMMSPIYIQRHLSDEIQAQEIDPILKESLDPAKITSNRVLLVDDTIGSAQTIVCALNEIIIHDPKSVDVFVVGLDHSLRHQWMSRDVLTLLGNLIVCYDYWGWLVFPWENQAMPESLLTHFENIEAKKSLNDIGHALKNIKLEDKTYLEYIEKDFSLSPIYSTEDAFLKLSYPLHEVDIEIFRDSTEVIANHNVVDVMTLKELTYVALPSTTLIVAIGLFPSLLGCAFWTLTLRNLYSTLANGGHIIFDYLSREGIEIKADVCPVYQYYSSINMSKLMRRHGFIPVDDLALEKLSTKSKRVKFSRFKKDDRLLSNL